MNRCRIEPSLEDQPDRTGARRNSKPDRWMEMDDSGPSFDLDRDPGLGLWARVALGAVTLACLAFIGDRLWSRYQQHKLVEAAQVELERFHDQLNEIGRESRAQSAARAAEARERKQAQRRARAQTVQGRWLQKNCKDWTESYQRLGGDTSERQMRVHCGIYDRYLETGVAPPGTPR